MYQDQLLALKAMNISVAEKWNKAVWLLLTARMEPLKEKGVPQDNLFATSHQIHIAMQSYMRTPDGETLIQLDRTIWELLFRVVFERDLPTKLELKVIRRISLSLCTAIIEDRFTESLRAATQGLTLEQKNPIIIEKMQSLAIPIFETYGLTGEAGYLGVQKALVDYSSDPFVGAQTYAYNHLTTEAAGTNQ
jgi:hypothetical protein